MAHGSRIRCHDRSMYTPIDMKMQEGNDLFFHTTEAGGSVLGKKAPIKDSFALGRPLEKKA